MGLFRTVLPNRIHRCFGDGVVWSTYAVPYCNLSGSRLFNFFHGNSFTKPKRIGGEFNLSSILAENAKDSNIREPSANPLLSVPLTSNRFQQGSAIHSG